MGPPLGVVDKGLGLGVIAQVLFGQGHDPLFGNIGGPLPAGLLAVGLPADLPQQLFDQLLL